MREGDPRICGKEIPGYVGRRSQEMQEGDPRKRGKEAVVQVVQVGYLTLHSHNQQNDSLH